MGLFSKSLMELAVNHHQRKVLHAIFAHPVNANLDLKDVTNVLTGLGAEIDAKATRTDSSFADGTLRPRDVQGSGQPALAPEHAIVEYAEVLTQLRDALAALIEELTRPERLLSWWKLRAVPRPAAEKKTVARR